MERRALVRVERGEELVVDAGHDRAKPRLLAVIGESPAALTLQELARAVGWRVWHTRPRVETLLAGRVDPVCGMTIAVEGARETAVYEGVTYFFCNAGYRRHFEADPRPYLVSARPTRPAQGPRR